VIFYPSVFNMVTGPLHWELLLRSRAIDNQCYTVGCMPARYTKDTTIYQSWGHSSVVDPMGKVLVTCEEEATIIYADIDLENNVNAKKALPFSIQKRPDIYKLEDSKEIKQ